MNDETKNVDSKAIVPGKRQGLSTRSSNLISRGLSDLISYGDTRVIDIAKSLMPLNQLDGVLRTISEKIDEYWQLKSWSLFLLDEATQELYCQLSHGEAAGALKDVRMKVGEGIVGRVAMHGKSMVVDDLTEASSLTAESHERQVEGVKSVVAVPIRFQDRCLGVIELLNSSRTERLSGPDMRLLEELGEFSAIALENANRLGRLHELFVTDELTGLYCERHLHFVLETEIYRSQRYAYDFSIIRLELQGLHNVPMTDWLKKGIELHRGLASMLKSFCRLIDYAFQFGEAGYAMLLPQTTKEDACTIARRLHKKFSETLWLGGVKLSASIGVVSFPEDAQSKEDILNLADEGISFLSQRGRGGVAAANNGIIRLI